MSITLQFPTLANTANSQPPLAVVTPAVSPSGTLVSQRTMSNLSEDQTAVLAVQLQAGTYLVISSITVSGTPLASSIVPGLVVSYSDSDQFGNGTVPYTAVGAASLGSGVVDGYNITQSINDFTQDGLSAVTAGVLGGQYTRSFSASIPNWSYSVTVSIYRLS
jgi:hypothetical protein